MTPRDFVPPRWGTRRRTREEWLDLGGDPKVGAKGDVWWPTLGHQPAMVARRLLLPPMPHQQYIFDVAFELDPFSPGDLWYSESNVWVMRQVGKTMGIMFPVVVHRLTMLPRLMGGRQRAAFTMQDRQTTRQKLEIDMIPQLVDASASFRRIVNPKGRPGRSTAEWKSSLNNGSEYLLFGQGNYMLIETPSIKAGHGNTLDLKMGDEVRFGVDDRLEASAASQITRRSRQLWVASTAGDELSFYMWPKVVACRNRIERGDTETRVCSFEWVLPEDADLHDPDVWYEFHPAAGHTIAVDDLIDLLRKAEDSPDETKVDTFRQEYANQWIRHPIIGEQQRELTFEPTLWASREVPVSEPGQPCVIGVSVSDDGRSSSIAVTWWIGDGSAVAKVLDRRPGTFWIEQELAVRKAQLRPDVITYDAGGPTLAIAGSIARAAGDTPVDPISGRAYTSACAGVVTGFEEGRYRHMNQEWLNIAVDGTSKKRRGESWLWDLQTATADPSPWVAVTVAFRALEGRPAETAPNEPWFAFS